MLSFRTSLYHLDKSSLRVIFVANKVRLERCVISELLTHRTTHVHGLTPMLHCYYSVGSLFLVGLLWGCSNPLMKLGSRGITKAAVGEAKTCKTIFKELYFLCSNWKYIIPLLLNQMGSIVYFFMLQTNSILYCVPLANSIAFLVTIVISWILGERAFSQKILLGTTCIIIGIACYMIDIK